MFSTHAVAGRTEPTHPARDLGAAGREGGRWGALELRSVVGGPIGASVVGGLQARHAKGGASALDLTFYDLGGTLGSLLPGLAWERWGWPGVLTACIGAVAIGLGANALLCAGPGSRRVSRADGN